MIRAARFIAVVVGGATLATAVAGSSFAADGSLTFNLPAAVYYEQDESGRSDVDKNRCQVAVFVEYPKITRAVSYEIVIRLPKQNNREMQFVAPPFEKTGFTARYPPPDGFGPGSIVQIGALDGGSVLVGPNMTVRLTRRGFDVLEQPVTPGFTLKPGGGGQDYKVRTCNAVLAVRG